MIARLVSLARKALESRIKPSDGCEGSLVCHLTRRIHDALHEHYEHYVGHEEEAEDVKPTAVFEGRVTLCQLSAPALTGEYELGEYDPKTGMREVKKPGEKVEGTTRLTTFMDDEERGEQITVRWERNRGKIKLSRARKDEIWRVEFYKVADAKEVALPTVPGSSDQGYNPYGGQSGGMS
jgi:hypothetical protein